MEINKDKLTHMGSMNYILQVFKDEDEEGKFVRIDQYQPRRNLVWSGEIHEAQARVEIEETIERMKIAIMLFQEFLDGKRDYVYYWQLDENK